MLPDWSGPFTLGIYIASVAGLLLHWVALASGSTSQSMGDLAERWTRDGVEPLKRRGWKTIHNARLGYGDIDTVVIGPAGVVVIETKWTGSDWTEPFNLSLLESAGANVQRSAKSIETLLHSNGLRSLERTYAVVATWQPIASDRPTKTSNGAVVLAGSQLADWIAGLPPVDATDADIRKAWEVVATTTQRRDANELAKHGQRPRTPTEFLGHLAQYPVGAITGLTGGVLLGQLPPFPLQVLVPIAIAFFARWSRRFDRIERAAHAAYLTSTAVTLLFSGVIVYAFLAARS